MADITRFLKAVRLPVMPEVAQALIRTLSDEEADVPTISKVIAKDPALIATLLRMANSAMFGLSRSVESLDTAISVVGMSQIRARALSICMTQAFHMPEGINRLEFWRSSVACAGYAQWLARNLAIDDSKAWLTGMMLRLGEIIIVQAQPGVVAPLERQPCTTETRWAREGSLTGFDEGQVIAELARRWDFPDEISTALDASVQPMQTLDFSRLGAVVHLAALLAGSPSDAIPTLDALPVAVTAALQLDCIALQATVPHPDALSDTSTLLG